MLSRILTIALFALFFQACGEGSQDEIIYQPNKTQIQKPELPREERLLALDHYKVECEDSERCSAQTTVGILIVGSDYSFCTGTLIDSQTVLTNHHCIQDLYESGKDCSSRIVVKNANGDEAYCQEIVAPFAQDKGLNDDPSSSRFARDAALIKLSQPLASPVNISQNFQFQSNQSAHILAVNPPLSGSLTAKMEVKDCEATQNTNVFPSFQGQASSFVPLFNCTNQPRGGNSGSMIVNSQGQPMGLFAWEYGIAQKRVPSLQSHPSFAPDEKINFNVGININCLDFNASTDSLGWNQCQNHDQSGIDLLNIYSGRS